MLHTASKGALVMTPVWIETVAANLASKLMGELSFRVSLGRD
jgi:hypothetical protein